MEFDKNESFIRCKFVTEPVVFHTLFAMEKTSLLVLLKHATINKIWQINRAGGRSTLVVWLKILLLF